MPFSTSLKEIMSCADEGFSTHAGSKGKSLDSLVELIQNNAISLNMEQIDLLHFLDLGAGIGSIVAKAQELGFASAHGLEKEPSKVNFGNWLLQKNGFNPTLILGDYFNLNSNKSISNGISISDIDVFYLYEYRTLFSESSLMPSQSWSNNGVLHGKLVFERVFVEYAKKGAVLLREDSVSKFHEDAIFLLEHSCQVIDVDTSLGYSIIQKI